MNKESKEFGDSIKWVGNSYTNKSSRRNHTPKMICNHITEGTTGSCVNWFTSGSNYVSSAHFLVAKNGTVYQFVDIEDAAWTNGLARKNIHKSTSALVRSINCSPNWYSVTVEHAGVWSSTKGKLTKAQLKASIMLEKYIIAYVEDTYKHTIEADREHILGHYEISPVRKVNCPGQKFQFKELIEGINKKKEQVLKMSDLRKILEIKECKWADPEIDLAIEYGLLTQDHKSDEIVTLGVLMTILNRMYEKFNQ